MKLILTLLLLTQWFNVVFGQNDFPWPYPTDETIISITEPDRLNPIPTAIFEGQESTAWTREIFSTCYSVVEAYVDYKDNNIINIFDRIGLNPGCPPPGVVPPPFQYPFIEITKIRGLAAGTYTVRYYPYTLDYLDYPISDEMLAEEYFTEYEFEVLGAVSIDATSRWSLLLLSVMIMALAGFIRMRSIHP